MPNDVIFEVFEGSLKDFYGIFGVNDVMFDPFWILVGFLKAMTS